MKQTTDALKIGRRLYNGRFDDPAGPLLGLEYLDYYEIEQYLDEHDASIFVLRFEYQGKLASVKIFHFDSSLNFGYYDGAQTVKFANIRGLYDEAQRESEIKITSDAFKFTEQELEPISKKFKYCRNFYDIEHLIVKTILANYMRFTHHEKLKASIDKQAKSID